MPIGINQLAAAPTPAEELREESSQSNCKDLHLAATGDSRTHVLFMIDELYEMGGAERVLLKMIRLLPRDTFRCSLLTFKVREELKELNDIGCLLWVLPLGKTYDWNALKAARRIRKFIRQQRVSIVHTFFETSDIWGVLVARLSGCPVVVSSRRDLGILRSTKHRIAYKLFRRLYDRVLAVSPQVRDFCIQADGLDPRRVRTLFNGLEMAPIVAASSRQEMRRENAIPEDVPVIIAVANIRRVKGIDVMVRAAGLVCRRYPQALFLVIGRLSEQDYCLELESSIRALGLAGNFRLLGSREDVYSQLKMSDVFCLPSRSEGFSNALLEGMACCLPCVATDVGGNREALEDGHTGFIVPSEDWEEMGRRILALLDNRELAAAMGQRAEAVIAKRFTAEAMMTDLVDIYNGLLQAKGL
ncbi:MAG TPA: glycosyltransferase [Candidatus Saccharimonadales bacterium]|jgi:glycosyltransferase involved in cell wall biosynthesis|nr:glycosyltransferase [Candidatus Saccharimonadales bacterium]